MKRPHDNQDLAPCDFILFGELKSQLTNKLFHEESQLLAAQIFAAVFAPWVSKFRLCVDLDGA
jgi:hypothetical protein